MPKETSYLQVRLSPKLKQSFEAICKEREISLSDATRDLIANLVRNHTRQSKPLSKKDD